MIKFNSVRGAMKAIFRFAREFDCRPAVTTYKSILIRLQKAGNLINLNHYAVYGICIEILPTRRSTRPQNTRKKTRR